MTLRARPAKWKTAAGFSLLELGVSAIIVAVLVGAVLQRVDLVQQRAELAAVERVVAIMRTALAVRSAQLKLQRRDAELPLLVGQNPMEWLLEKPANYAGQYYSPSRAQVQPGTWYFERSAKQLVYLLNKGKSIANDRPKQLAFEVKLEELPHNNDVPVSIAKKFDVVLIQVDG